ncbi:hypothetical protein CF87_gp40 [Sulfolobus monocaudavirus SMV1]|uniref:hypothetical protein n=1 Tax=Sulfolobus monocaudavirus SMV1 TaxID=1351702 RepID=UPI0003D8AC0B|nr:hypothetical protein CF87_gp40 [Sulfolobus monocaudavirus SMV1]CDF81367.1 hypothetical protein [Sulfolobus monocaudavirus SMV1]
MGEIKNQHYFSISSCVFILSSTFFRCRSLEFFLVDIDKYNLIASLITSLLNNLLFMQKRSSFSNNSSSTLNVTTLTAFHPCSMYYRAGI